MCTQAISPASSKSVIPMPASKGKSLTSRRLQLWWSWVSLFTTCFRGRPSPAQPPAWLALGQGIVFLFWLVSQGGQCCEPCHPPSCWLPVQLLSQRAGSLIGTRRSTSCHQPRQAGNPACPSVHPLFLGQQQHSSQQAGRCTSGGGWLDSGGGWLGWSDSQHGQLWGSDCVRKGNVHL